MTRRKNWGKSLFWLVSIFCWVTFIMFGCSSGGDDEKKAKPRLVDVGGTIYNTAAAFGDLLLLQVNPLDLKFSYLFVEGELKGERDHGALVPLTGFGGYVYETDGDSALVLLSPDQLVLVAPPDGPGLLAGLPQRTENYPVSEIAGTYNIIFYGADTSEPNYKYMAVSECLRINEGGTWEVWWGSTAEDYSHQPPMDSGTWVDHGNGVIYALRAQTKIANVMLLPETGVNGAKLIVIDVCDGTTRGMAVGIKREAIAAGVGDGLYDLLSSDADEIYTAAIEGTAIAINLPGGAMVRTLTFNVPWEGFVTLDDGTIMLIHPSGFLFGGYHDLNPSVPDKLFAGIKEPTQ